ncbi:MAG: hypothetical protein ACYDBQ_06595 [Thermoplasmatota archaeon]
MFLSSGTAAHDGQGSGFVGTEQGTAKSTAGPKMPANNSKAHGDRHATTESTLFGFVAAVGAPEMARPRIQCGANALPTKVTHGTRNLVVNASHRATRWMGGLLRGFSDGGRLVVA